MWQFIWAGLQAIFPVPWTGIFGRMAWCLTVLALAAVAWHQPGTVLSQHADLHMDEPAILMPVEIGALYVLPEVPLTVAVYLNGLRLKQCTDSTGSNCDYGLRVKTRMVHLRVKPSPDDVLVFDTWR